MRDGLGSVQSVVVLGGTSDIAQATVRALVADRCRTVVLAARRPERLAGFVDELRSLGAGDVSTVALDADDPATHPRALDEAFAGRRDIDLVLVTLGVLGRPEETTTDPQAALDVLRTNTLGSVSLTMLAVERLRRQGHGTVVVLSSVAAERVRRSNPVYGASKAALDGFASALDDSLDGSGVRVMVVRPGFVHTKMTAGLQPAPFSTTPEAVASAIVDGVRRQARTVWVPPALRWVMVGVRHLPRPIFRRLPL